MHCRTREAAAHLPTRVDVYLDDTVEIDRLGQEARPVDLTYQRCLPCPWQWRRYRRKLACRQRAVHGLCEDLRDDHRTASPDLLHRRIELQQATFAVMLMCEVPIVAAVAFRKQIARVLDGAAALVRANSGTVVAVVAFGAYLIGRGIALALEAT